MTALKFNKVKNLPTSGYNVGDVFFVSSEKKIYIRTASGWEEYNGGFTTAEKTKLAGIEAGANKVTKVSQLTNDEHYINNSTLYEAKLKWGGDNFSGTYGPLDAALVSNLGANRLAFLPSECIDIEYSRDGGVTWNNYTTTDSDKISLFISRGVPYYIGGASEKNIDKSTHQLRITIKNVYSHIYNEFKKFVLYVSTNGSTGCWCTIDGRLQSDVEADNDTWKIFINKQHVSGWSGYNVLNYPYGITTYGNYKTSQYGNVRFTFGCESHNQNYGGLNIMSIQGFGGEGWTTPSTLALTGHLYDISTTKAATFPGRVYATELMEGNIALSSKYAPKSHTHKASDITDLVIPDISDKQNKTDNALTTTSKQVVGAINEVNTLAKGKQDKLTSGTNIKTVNGKSLLGSGDIAISGGGDVTAAGDNTFTGNNVFTQFVHSNYGFTIQNENINCSYYLAINTDGKFWISDDSDMDVEVTGVDTPTQDNAAANKKYVDDKVAAAGGVANKLTVTNFDSNSGRPISIQDTDLNDVLYVENNVGISYDGPMLTIKKCDNGSGSASCDAYVTNICGKGIEIGSASNGDYDYGTVISKGEILLYGSPVVTKESIRTALPIGTSSISSTTTETIRLVSSTTSTHRIILANSSGTKTILLPANPYDGETFEIIRIEGVSFILTNNSGKAMQKCTGTTTVTSMNISSSGKYTCIYSSSVNRWYVMRDDFVSF